MITDTGRRSVGPSYQGETTSQSGLRKRDYSVRLFKSLVALGAALVGADLSHAQPTDQSIAVILAAKAQRTPAQRKLSSQFLDAAGNAQPSASVTGQQAQPASVTGVGVTNGVRADVTPPEPVRPRAVQVMDEQVPTADVEDAAVTVDIRADVTDVVLARIRALGGTVLNSVPQYRAIRARLPLAALEPLARLEAVQFIRPADQAITHQMLSRPAVAEVVVTAKLNTTEGDVAHQANTARTTHSVDGSGISIGVLSDGVVGLANQQATGDVPAQVTVLPGQEGRPTSFCGRPISGNEGVAMLEIIHDLAPGAELFFATGFGGAAEMAQNIEALCDAGADIIVDDIGYLLAPAFQDGVIAQAVSAVVAKGCYYFSSAGNGGNLNDGTSGVWEGDFAAGTALSLERRRDWGCLPRIRQRRHREPDRVKDSTFPISLQWADPMGWHRPTTTTCF